MELDGSYSNESEAAYALSCREQDPGDVEKIMKQAADGKYVLYYEYTTYCTFTDATTGTAKQFVTAYDTEDEALRECKANNEHMGSDDLWYAVEAPPKPTALEEERQDEDPSDLPF